MLAPHHDVEHAVPIHVAGREDIDTAGRATAGARIDDAVFEGHALDDLSGGRLAADQQQRKAEGADRRGNTQKSQARSPTASSPDSHGRGITRTGPNSAWQLNAISPMP